MDTHDLTNSLYWVGDRVLAADFPPTDRALSEPDGLLAIGGDLSPERLLEAYARGIFPWFSEGQPILWWSPDPRSALAPSQVQVSHSLRKTLRNGAFDVSWDEDFHAVIEACAAPRARQTGTWITGEMRAAYEVLHQRGVAHSIECRRDGRLCGGLYGLALGRVFFGESMFSQARDASKLAFVTLCRRLGDWGYRLIDCQIHTPHLESLGARKMPRADFEAELARSIAQPPAADAWRARGWTT